MIPAQFDYVAAESTAHALGLLTQHGDDAKLLAGGHSLLPMMKLRLAQPEVLIDIGGLAELAGVSLDGGPLKLQVDAARQDYLRIPNDDLLKGFRRRAGRPAPGADLGGWYSSDVFHVFGTSPQPRGAAIARLRPPRAPPASGGAAAAPPGQGGRWRYLPAPAGRSAGLPVP